MKAGIGLTALTLATLTFAGAASAQDVAAGEQILQEVHGLPFDRRRRQKQGLGIPELNGLDGRHSGTAPGYSYSEANKKSGIVWAKDTFEKYINDPRAMVPGTKMIFPGIKNPKEVEYLWAYVSQFGPDGKKK